MPDTPWGGMDHLVIGEGVRIEVFDGERCYITPEGTIHTLRYGYHSAINYHSMELANYLGHGIEGIMCSDCKIGEPVHLVTRVEDVRVRLEESGAWVMICPQCFERASQ